MPPATTATSRSEYPHLLWYKAVAGTKDVIGEMRGVIDTEEKFHNERLRMAELVWDEYKENDSRELPQCHVFSPEVLAKQKEGARPMHQRCSTARRPASTATRASATWRHDRSASESY